MEYLSSRYLAGVLAGILVGINLSCIPDSNEQRQNGKPDWQTARHAMVAEIEARGVGDVAVLEAMRSVPRHEFVNESSRSSAYDDVPLPIGDGQSTPQPYVVALMTELLELEPGARVLEVGTGSGYQTAVLAAMGIHVYSIEIRQGLCDQARETLDRLGYATVTIRCDDGYAGWSEEAPFDGILISGAWEDVPEPLYEQLAERGRLVMPFGESLLKDLRVVTRTAEGFEERSVIPVSFEVLDHGAQDPTEEE